MVLLIKSSEITKNTPMGGNVDPDKYIYCVKDAQVSILEPLLGTKLFDKILADFASDSLTGIYATLVNEYLKPILIHSAFADYVVIGAYNVANGGIYKHNPQNSETVSKSEIDYLAEKQRGKAQVYIERAERYLCANDFPEYKTQDNSYDIKSQDINYLGGWKL
jgi:hypothetical protein